VPGIQCTWTVASSGGSGLTGHVVQRRTGDGPWATLATVAASATSYVDTTALPGTQYGYRHAATNALGTAAFSPEVRVTTRPSGPTTRDAVLQPFSSQSVWNLPIATAATFEAATAPRTADLVSAVKGRLYVNQASYSHPVVQATAADPVHAVPDRKTASRSSAYRIPAHASIAVGTDAHMHVISPDGTYVDEAYNVRHPDGSTYDAARRHRVDLLGTGLGPQNGTRAYGGSALGGLIRAWEVDPTHPAYTGVIRHALAIALDGTQLHYSGGSFGYNSAGHSTALGYVWPATEQDSFSTTGYTGAVPMGAYFAIPPSVDITRLGLSPSGLMVARALQDYGGYVTDRASGVAPLYVEPSAPAGFRNELLANSARDLATIQAQLRVVTSNSAATPNGGPLGAPRRQPLLPPLAAAPAPVRPATGISRVGDVRRSATTGTTATIATGGFLPAAGDVVYVTGHTYGTRVMTPPPGWVQLVNVQQNSNSRTGMWRRVITGTEAAADWTWRLDAASGLLLTAVCLRGVDTTTPEDGPVLNRSSSVAHEIGFGPLTAAQDGAVVLAAVTSTTGAQTATWSRGVEVLDERTQGSLSSHVAMERLFAGTHAARTCTVRGWVTVAAGAVVVRPA
jgi:hypothetical protein